MLYPFSKYSGCGNDFVLFDNRSCRLCFSTPQEIRNICSRETGVGADGIVVLENSDRADFRMRIFNCDGSEAEMCGNGLRCLVRFLSDIGLPQKNFNIETMQAVYQSALMDELICITMPEPTDIQWKIPIKIDTLSYFPSYLNTGVPHAVFFIEDIEEADLKSFAPKVRFHPCFSPRGTNVNYVQVLKDKNEILVRTYERGVEQETLACGTGVVASALVAAKTCGLKGTIRVRVRSGDYMQVSFDPLRLIGPAKRIFTGELELDDFN